MGDNWRKRLLALFCALFSMATFLVSLSSANLLQTSAIPRRASGSSSFVFPLEGNVYPNGYFYATVNIGNPPKPYFLDIDTGSDLTWVQCDAGPGSKLLRAPHIPYKPRKNVMFCKDPLCAFVNHPSIPCKAPGDQCDYEVAYADHGSSLGVLVRDSFPLGFTNGSVVQPNLAFGCGYDQEISAPYPPPFVDGVLGLSSGKPSIISQLHNLSLTRNVVSHCFSGQGGGFLFIGDDFIPPGATWTPMLLNRLNHYAAGPVDLLFGEKTVVAKALYLVFDSGSTYTYLNSKVYQATLSLVRAQLKGKPLNEVKDGNLPICWRGSRPFRSVAEVRNYFNPLVLSFTTGKNVHFILPPEAYLTATFHGNICLGILNSADEKLGTLNVIGDIAMLDKLLIYDNERRVIGWAPSKCGRLPNPQVTFIST